MCKVESMYTSLRVNVIRLADGVRPTGVTPDSLNLLKVSDREFMLIFCSNLIFSLPSSGKTVKKEPGNEEGQQQFDEADKLLQEFQDAQVDRVGSRPSSNLSSLSNASERDQHHLGTCN